MVYFIAVAIHIAKLLYIGLGVPIFLLFCLKLLLVYVATHVRMQLL